MVEIQGSNCLLVLHYRWDQRLVRIEAHLVVLAVIVDCDFVCVVRIKGIVGIEVLKLALI